ncbi:receptor-like protein 12 [Durio zibethinus]|uniref:Receptor-like protein 12 n=1 Tax=Durio zibethinus TaxID=66656 RepID=A0A6P5WP50_DURZI|nr:receptor-like protein 12 [Durio zibethinus]
MGFVPRFYPCLWLLFFLNSHASLLSSTTHLCSDEEAAALMQFKNSFSINRTAARICEFHSVKSYPKTNSWKEGTDCCSWDGITCDKITGHVTGLDLSCSWLRGPFFSNSSLFLLSHLQRLNLAANFFQRSRIPSEFGRFANLSHLNLSRSWFSGSVPNEISHLTELVSLDLSSDDPSIPFPLRTLELDDPTVEGIVHNLTKVRELILYGINMSSVNPSCLMNLSSSLTSLNLFGCSIRGNFPNNIFSLPNLKSLNLKRNPDLVGYLPKFNWSGPLENLILPITSFSGQLPDSIGDLLSLRHLDLAFCKFSGSIPSSLGKLSLLTYLDLSYNSFSGQIPSSLASLTRLEVLDASENQLVGSIPSQVTAFPSLIDLDLSANLLNGTIPSWVYSLPSLQYLNLRYNQLMSHINEFQHNSLREISLENNKLQGPIPSSISELVNLTRLDMSSNNLSGLVQLDMFLKLQNLRFLSLSDNSLSLSSNIWVNFTLPNLKELYFSSCNISEFPIFLQGSNNLSRLDLSNNRIRGGIPKWMLATPLENFSIS